MAFKPFMRTGKANDYWQTPRELVIAIGPFDLDPCAAEEFPLKHAKRAFTERDDGLHKQWEGSVFMNPPYSQAAKWLAKIAEHKDGVALVPATSTQTKHWQEHVWPKAAAIFFPARRINFINAQTGLPESNPPMTTCFVIYGKHNLERFIVPPVAGYMVWLTGPQ